MNAREWIVAIGTTMVIAWSWLYPRQELHSGAAEREAVVFWHFWGGDERAVVDHVVERFNSSQSRYQVQAIAMPGNNLDVKLFMAIVGGQPPDLVNHDDPILADWALRRAIEPLASVASDAELHALQAWMVPAAWELCSIGGRPYGLCNGLDVRALFYNATLLSEHGLQPPRTLAELDRLARELDDPPLPELPMANGLRKVATPQFQRIGFLPNPRNIWSWGIVFGGAFVDPATGAPTPDDAAVTEAMKWMASYGRRYGIAATRFRERDQSLPGKPFALLAGRYALMEDGQWRCRDIRRYQEEQRTAGDRVTEFGVCAFPPPPTGYADAGWINGNFFVIPRGAKQPHGAWEFMKFWTGFGGHQDEAAETCALGGWIPVSAEVSERPAFRAFLATTPLFAEFVRLAGRPHQRPRPNIPGAAWYDREIVQAASAAIYRADERNAKDLVSEVRQRAERQWDAYRENWSNFLQYHQP